MRSQVHAVKVCAWTTVRGHTGLTCDVTAVGLLTTVDNTLSFLSLVFFLFDLFPNMWSSFISILVIIPPFPRFGHSSMLRAGVVVVTVPPSPSLQGFLCICDIPTGHAVLASTVLGICSPGFFHATMLPSTPRSQSRQCRHTSIMATSGVSLFCSGSQ